MSGDIATQEQPHSRIARLRRWTLMCHDGGDLGFTDHESWVISIRRGQVWAQRRCTLVHECVHAVRGPALASLEEREELRVRRLTARLLLPQVRPIGDALAWSQLRVAEAADELGVDTGVLRDRLDYLHRLELRYLRRRLADF